MPISTHLSELGGTGLTAQVGRTRTTRLREDDDLFVSASAGPVADLLAEAAPDGVDVYVDNVGGEHLGAAIGALRDHRRVERVGTASQYDTAIAPPAVFDHADVVEKSLRLTPLLVRAVS